jgi:tetratricopeptide (TPR) repeat protein
MRTASPKLDTTHLDKNDEAELKCRTALELKDRGEYGAARDAMFPLWKGIGSRPDTKELREDLVPRVLLVAGILTGWLGGQSEIQKDKDPARDLISESIRLYEELGDIRKVAEARVELAQCYWRAGDNDTARILLSTALERLTTGGPAQANALLILSSVEWAESRYNEVLKILTLNAPLFERITNHTIKGVYHNQLGITLRAIGASKKRLNYFQRAIQQYHLADEEFRLAKHPSFRVLVKNNIANVLRERGQFTEAHAYLEQARRLMVRVGDKVRVAQIDDTLAQVFMAEGKYGEAEWTASRAARGFEKAGRQCFLAETLVNQGIALARMREPQRAQFIFQEAIEIAHNAGSLNRAGLAALAMIEELHTLTPELRFVAFEQAREWLASSDSPDVKPRLRSVEKKIGSTRTKLPANPLEVLFNKRIDLYEETLRYQHDLISETLVKVDGKVTHAAKLLGVNRQSLAKLIETKHPDLLKMRTPIRRRPRKKIKATKTGR